MLGEQKASQILGTVLQYSRADQTEALLAVTNSALTRFADNTIHQNVAETDSELSVRVVLDKRIGIATVNDVSDEGIKRAVDTATTIAQHQEPNPEFVSLPAPGRPAPRVDGFVERTARHGPRRRAEDVGTICRLAQSEGLVASGAFRVAVTETAVSNSLGVSSYHADTLADITTVIMGDSSSGHADRWAADVGEIDPESVAREAIDKALRSRNPITLEPGHYEVILEEYAVCDILDYLAYLGLGALSVQEGRSFMGDKFGQPLVGPNISIRDDGIDPRTVPAPFDYEGVAKQRVDFIVDGVANAVCYDSFTAHREGKLSTGHALPAGNTIGPLPRNMFLQPGDATREQMLASTRHGLWVTRFHYTRPVHPLKVIVTGMTRDGTFLIENGEVTRPVRNLRFTQDYLEALSNVEMIGRETRITKELYPFNRVPTLKIASWNFQGSTAEI